MPAKRSVSRKKSNKDYSDDEDNYQETIKNLKNQIKKLEKSKKTRKLSALNKFKKYVISKSTEQALIDADYSDLIPIDKIRLLNRAYPIMWDNLVLQPLYEKHGIRDPREQEAFKRQKDIQEYYHEMVDSIIHDLKNGELDDRQHYREDITEIVTEAIRTAAKTFDAPDDENNDEEEDE